MTIRRSLFCALILLTLTSSAFAQSTTPQPVDVGKPIQLAFDEPADCANIATRLPGLSCRYRFYVSGQPQDSVVFGTPVNGTYTFIFPPFTSTGTRALTVSARYFITDGTLWRCGTPGTGTNVLDCAEAMSDPLNINVLAPTTPAPPKPVLRFIRVVTTIALDANGNVVNTQSTSSAINAAPPVGPPNVGNEDAQRMAQSRAQMTDVQDLYRPDIDSAGQIWRPKGDTDDKRGITLLQVSSEGVTFRHNAANQCREKVCKPGTGGKQTTTGAHFLSMNDFMAQYER